MVELLCVLRTPGTWHFLCLVCVIEAALMLLQMTELPPAGDVIIGSAGGGDVMDSAGGAARGEVDDVTRLEQVMKLQDQIRKGIQENRQLLQKAMKEQRRRNYIRLWGEHSSQQQHQHPTRVDNNKSSNNTATHYRHKTGHNAASSVGKDGGRNNLSLALQVLDEGMTGLEEQIGRMKQEFGLVGD